MKTIISNGAYQRVSNEVAEHEVSFGRAKYVPKSEWKKNARDLNKTVVSEEQLQKHEDTLSKKALKRSKLKSKQRELDPSDNFLKK